MRMVDMIITKRQGKALSKADIQFIIKGYVDGSIPDYQVSSLLMAILFNGMSSVELAALVHAMIDSGERFDLSSIPGIPVDKHSTGGVGDKVSLILAPIVAAAGVNVPMISGRGLGHTGGTLDKLDAIPGFKTQMDAEQFVQNIEKIGLSMSGQSENFVPADKKLYALRDVTGTVESIPLICSSIMSKKIAEGAKGLVLDVKCGNGAFMDSLEDAQNLAQTLVGIGKETEVQTTAIITDMNQPLGHAVGHANEILESIECLKGIWPKDLEIVTVDLCAEMIVIAGVAKNLKEARELIYELISSGKALEKFQEMCEIQGGDPRVTEDYSMLKIVNEFVDVEAPETGFVSGFNTREVGNAAAVLGAGRAKKTDTVDLGVGIWVLKNIGEPVEKGEPVFRVGWRDENKRDACVTRLKKAFSVSESEVEAPEIIKDRIS